MASTARTATSQASRALSSTPTAAPRRVSKRTRSSSPLSSLTSLYHLTPTFVPTASPSALSSHLNNTLAPTNALLSRPKPSNLHDLVTAQMLLDNERIRLPASHSLSTTLIGLDLTLPSTSLQHHTSYNFLQETKPFDHRESVYSAFTAGGEPFLAQRVRRVVDALHGTTAGGRAGVETVRERGEKAKEWKVGLGEAREREKVREKEQEREAEEFDRAFNGGEEGARP